MGSIETIIESLEDFERYVSRKDTPEEQRIFASTVGNCIRASDRGKSFYRGLGLFSIRKEVHYPNSALGSGHTFLSDVTEFALAPDDIIIDPTYLQFADNGADLRQHPTTFVGTREEILVIVSDVRFCADPTVADLYGLNTWIPGKS